MSVVKVKIIEDEELRRFICIYKGGRKPTCLRKGNTCWWRVRVISVDVERSDSANSLDAHRVLYLLAVISF